MIKKILLLTTILILVGCTQVEIKHETQLIENPPTPPKVETKTITPTKAIEIKDVTLKASDNTRIKGTYYESNGNSAILLLHMLNRDRSDWSEFAKILQEKYSVLAIDLRGHGESSYDWRKFGSDEFNNMILDTETGFNYLYGQGKTNVAIIGASIGANVALNYANSNTKIKTIIMLSPGKDYKGVKTINQITQNIKPILIVASEGDEYSASSAFELDTKSQNSKLIMYKFGHHGTQLLGKRLGLEKEINEWLTKYIST